ncbi:dual specificity protein phosphatase [Coprinopsis marcescibilis]|uniref:Dual specificity protein phosphatase n=1 Tax=Coprinopsis marcescibilis TaxID=230819 RepID=A0A5C3KV43_COPMA|nr:dual specificity protein phosphatase [Coprinopsis marcescibilis]
MTSFFHRLAGSGTVSPSFDSPPTSGRGLQRLQRKIKALRPAEKPYIRRVGSPRPLPNSYWATPLLVACEYPWTPKDPNNPKLDDLLRVGVRTFIDLTEDGELLPYEDILCKRAGLLGIDPSTIEYHRFPIRDRSLPNSIDFMDQVFITLRLNEQRGRVSAIHCRGGIGRTGVVVGCWLVESGAACSGEEALRIIDAEWRSVEKCNRYPHSPETGPQFDFVFNFERRSPIPKLSANRAEVVCRA